MVWRFLIALCLIIQFDKAAAQVPRNILKIFSEEQIKSSLLAPGKWHPFPTTPQEWEKDFPDSILLKIVKEGEAALKLEYPQLSATVSMDYMRMGDSKARYEPILFQKRNMLFALILAESVEGKGRFTDKIADGVWAICEETFWGTTSILNMQKKGKGIPDVSDPIVDLYAAETASLLAWTDYFSGTALDKLSGIFRERIRHEVKRRVFDPILTANYFYLVNPKPNNWAPWIMSNYVAAQLLLEADEDKRAKAIVFALMHTDKYINALGEDGSSDEGPGYWSQAVGCVFDELNLLHEASSGKLSVYNHPYLDKMGSYIYKVHLSGKNFVNIGDAVPGSTPNALMLYRYGKAVDDKILTNFASWVYHTLTDRTKSPYLTNSSNSRSRTLYNLAALHEMESLPFTKPSLADTYLSDVQIMTAKANNGLILAANGGHNGQNHNHNDVGMFLVYLNDQPVILDVGPGAYMAGTFAEKRYTLWFNRSEYHNVPIINGYGQGAGEEFTASDVLFKSGKSKTTFSLNLASAYPKEAGVKKWLRTVSMNNEKGVIEVTEDYSTESLKSLELVFMTICNTDLSNQGKIQFMLSNGEKVFMDYNPLDWDIKKEKMPLNNPEDKKFKETFKGRDIWRILLVSKNNRQEGKINYTFYK